LVVLKGIKYRRLAMAQLDEAQTSMLQYDDGAISVYGGIDGFARHIINVRNMLGLRLCNAGQ
jgi:hypothetical protein